MGTQSTWVVWPFGHGLSYTSFNYTWGSQMQLSKIKASVLAAGDVSFPVVVSNTGLIDGTVAVQIYVSILGAQKAPLRSLIAIDKVAVKASSSKVTVLRADAVNGSCAFCVYDDLGHRSVPPGTHYQVFVGNGAGSISVTPFDIVAV